ncbi:hypothetical protein OSB04_025488 [Centaurea solstitialis]|uniref:HMA domain-containing protein n=1 Tax=Centaurea solstitialis TaxID=347529 RepID=A0AA38WEU6_9ASTR|nr:hypothetical protein OSB04_025488 [Centaurea solstitialis]
MMNNHFLYFYSSHSNVPHLLLLDMAQKVTLKVLTMTDDKTRKKAKQAVVDIDGVVAIADDVKEQTLIVNAEMDQDEVVKKFSHIGKVEKIIYWPSLNMRSKKGKKDEVKKDKKKSVISDITVTLKIPTMIDAKTRRKAMEAVSDIIGVDSIEADLNKQTLTVIGNITREEVVKKFRQADKVEKSICCPSINLRRKKGKKDALKEDEK